MFLSVQPPISRGPCAAGHLPTPGTLNFSLQNEIERDTTSSLEDPVATHEYTTAESTLVQRPKKKMQIQPPASWSTFKYTDVVKHPGNWMNSLPHNKTQAWRKDSLASAVCPGCPSSPGWAENYISLPGRPESRWKGGTGSCPLNLIS